MFNPLVWAIALIFWATAYKFTGGGRSNPPHFSGRDGSSGNQREEEKWKLELNLILISPVPSVVRPLVPTPKTTMKERVTWF